MGNKGKNILGICASGHKNGNSQIVLNELIKPSIRKGYKVETLNIGEMHISQCSGCFSCMGSEKSGECSIKDDLKLIKSKIQEADAIAIASPSYCLSAPSKLRAIMERTANWALAEMSKSDRKKFGAAVSVASGTSSLVRTPLSLFMALYQCKIVGQFTITNAFHQGEVLLYPSRLEQVSKLGECLADSVENGKCMNFEDNLPEDMLRCTNCYADTFQVRADGTLVCPVCRMKLKNRDGKYFSEGFNRFSYEGARLYINGRKNIAMKGILNGQEIGKRLNLYLKDEILEERDFAACFSDLEETANVHWSDDALEILEAWLPSSAIGKVKVMIGQKAAKAGITNITKELLLKMN